MRPTLPTTVFVLGDLAWQALAVPGHDMDALALYNPEQRLLISGDALWQDGFGVVFAELLGNPDGQASRAPRWKCWHGYRSMS